MQVFKSLSCIIAVKDILVFISQSFQPRGCRSDEIDHIDNALLLEPDLDEDDFFEFHQDLLEDEFSRALKYYKVIYEQCIGRRIKGAFLESLGVGFGRRKVKTYHFEKLFFKHIYQLRIEGRHGKSTFQEILILSNHQELTQDFRTF